MFNTSKSACNDLRYLKVYATKKCMFNVLVLLFHVNLKS